jgi:hypothetical protein
VADLTNLGEIEPDVGHPEHGWTEQEDVPESTPKRYPIIVSKLPLPRKTGGSPTMAAEKFQELGRAGDGAGDAGGRDQFLLGNLGAEVGGSSSRSIYPHVLSTWMAKPIQTNMNRTGT